MRRHRWIIAGSGAILIVLLFLAWHTLRGHFAVRTSGVGTEPQLVSFGLACELKGGQTVFTGSLTNRVGVPIKLRGHAMLYEDERGRIVNSYRGWSQFHPWEGITNYDTLPADGVATISFGDVPKEAKRVQICFQYFFDAGVLQKAISQGVRKLPVNRLSQEEQYRLDQHGLLSGECQRSYDSDWVSTQPVQRTGTNVLMK